jgi:hypothetical protein
MYLYRTVTDFCNIGVSVHYRANMNSGHELHTINCNGDDAAISGLAC